MSGGGPRGHRRDDIVIFLGPSLPLADARARLDATYLPPAACGDILRARRLKPRAIGLIDGYFENAASVWHKELLAVLDDGVAVFGASSMGALRAAELDRFGMTGIGQIYRWYADRRIDGDDEVALLHGPASVGFVAMTDPLVNVRATLDAAVDAAIIDEPLAGLLLGDARATSYLERRLSDIVSRRLAETPPGEDRERLAALRHRVGTGFLVNQKALDAEALLLAIADATPSVATPVAPSIVNRSVFFRHLRDATNARALAFPVDCLPTPERQAACARVLGHTYLMLVRLARLLALSEAIERHEPTRATAVTSTPVDDATEIGEIDRDLRLWDGAAFAGRPALFLEQARSRIWAESARRWRRIEEIVDRQGFAVDQQEIQAFSDTFRRERRLLTQTGFDAWLKAEGLDSADYSRTVGRCARLVAVTEGEPVGLLGLSLDIRDKPWIVEAARLSGLTPFLDRCAALLDLGPPPTAAYPDLPRHIRGLGETAVADLGQYARDLDFDSREAFEAMIGRLSPVLRELHAREPGQDP